MGNTVPISEIRSRTDAQYDLLSLIENYRVPTTEELHHVRDVIAYMEEKFEEAVKFLHESLVDDDKFAQKYLQTFDSTQTRAWFDEIYPVCLEFNTDTEDMTTLGELTDEQLVKYFPIFGERKYTGCEYYLQDNVIDTYMEAFYAEHERYISTLEKYRSKYEQTGHPADYWIVYTGLGNDEGNCDITRCVTEKSQELAMLKCEILKFRGYNSGPISFVKATVGRMTDDFNVPLT